MLLQQSYLFSLCRVSPLHSVSIGQYQHGLFACFAPSPSLLPPHPVGLTPSSRPRARIYCCYSDSERSKRGAKKKASSLSLIVVAAVAGV